MEARRVDVTETLNGIARATSVSCEMCELNWHREQQHRETISALCVNFRSARRAEKIWRGWFFVTLLIAAFSIGERMVKP